MMLGTQFTNKEKISNFISTEELAQKTAGGIGFIRTKNGEVKGIAIQKSINKDAPEILVVGNGPTMLKNSQLFFERSYYVPVYQKHDTDQWEYLGNYRSTAFKTSQRAIKKHQGDRVNVGGILFLEKEQASNGASDTQSKKHQPRQTCDHQDDSDIPPFNPNDAQDGRDMVMRQVAVRRGQPKFRNSLMSLYNSRCVISDCDVDAVLEAAHITPYNGDSTNHDSNGLLLRSDLHTLWDRGLLAIDPNTYTVWVAPESLRPPYAELNGKKIPDTIVKHAKAALESHWGQVESARTVLRVTQERLP